MHIFRQLYVQHLQTKLSTAPSSLLTGHSSDTSYCCSDVSKSQRSLKKPIKLTIPMQSRPTRPSLGTENDSIESMQTSAKSKSTPNLALFRLRQLLQHFLPEHSDCSQTDKVAALCSAPGDMGMRDVHQCKLHYTYLIQ